MSSTPGTIKPNQLKRTRTLLWHQDGDALRTADDARTWLEAAGLVPYYPHPQFAAAPQPSFAEAILGRPETGWIASAARVNSSEESVPETGDEEPEEDTDEEEDFDHEDQEEDENLDPDEEQEDGDDEDEEDGEDEEQGDDENEEQEDDEVAASPEASDPEVTLSNEDEFAEDEGDEIAEIDRIDAGGDPVPNDLREGSTAATAPEEPAKQPVNGFSAEEKETVHRTLARMVAEGSAVPLNLLGSTTGEPDFICSAQAFSFVYTLRGDKGWKQEPAQTGSMRVSPLAVKV